MLSKDDLNEINKIFKRELNKFFNDVLVPYFDEKFTSLDKRFEDRGKRIKRLESITAS